MFIRKKISVLLFYIFYSFFNICGISDARCFLDFTCSLSKTKIYAVASTHTIIICTMQEMWSSFSMYSILIFKFYLRTALPLIDNPKNINTVLN